MEEKEKIPFWLSSWFVVISLLVLPPVGIALLWIGRDFKRNAQIILTVSACCYMFFIFPLFIGAVIAPFIAEEKVVAIDKTTSDTFLDQRLTGSWMLSTDGYSGNDTFDYFTINFESGGKYEMEAKVAVNQQIIPMAGVYAVDKNGNLFLTKESGEQITYYYNLVDGAMILQYMEDGKVKLKKVENTPPPAATEQPATTAVSIDLSAGVYTIGVDIPPGKYDITAISGRGNFFGNPGIVNEIMGTEGDYTIPSYKNAAFKNGNTIEVKGTLVVNLTSK